MMLVSRILMLILQLGFRDVKTPRILNELKWFVLYYKVEMINDIFRLHANDVAVKIWEARMHLTYIVSR